MFKRTYLHIGLGKTGTSAIQKQLLANADLLEREHGIHFPSAFSQVEVFHGNHSRHLSAMFRDGDGPGPAQLVAGLQSPQRRAQYAENVRAQFESGFAASRVNHLLISAEAVGHFNRPSLQMLASWLRHFSQEIEIVACIRHPLDALSSEIQQRLKEGAVLEELYLNPPYYQLASLFARIAEAFPDSGMIIYDFREAVANRRGVTGEFLQKIGVNTDLPAFASKSANASMSHEAALLLSALNRARPLVVNQRRNQARSPRDLVELMGIPGRKFQAPAEVYERAGRLVAKELLWLKEKHGIELQAAPVSDVLDYRYFSDESIENIALRIAALSKMRGAPPVPPESAAPSGLSMRYFREVWKDFQRRIS